MPHKAAEIKVETFPFTRYGTLAGAIETVSRDAVQRADRAEGDTTECRGGTGFVLCDVTGFIDQNLVARLAMSPYGHLV